MDIKRLVISMILAMAVMLGWNYVVNTYYPSTPPSTQPVATAGPSTSASTGPATTAAAAGPSTGPMGMSVGLHADETVATGEAVTLGSSKPNDPEYPLALNLTAKGAAVDSVVLNAFKQVVNKPDRYTFQSSYPQASAASLSMAAETAIVDGTPVSLANVNWRLISRDATSAKYAIDVAGGSGPVVRIEKRYAIFDAKQAKDAGQGYEVSVQYRVQNLANRPVTVKLIFNGPTVPPTELERGGDRQIVSGYAGNLQRVELAHHAIEEFGPKQVTLDLTKDPKNNRILWAGSGSAYFNAIVLPQTPDQIEKVQAVTLNPDQNDAQLRHVALEFQTTTMTLPADGSAVVPLDVFFGPKKREVLEAPYYSSFPRNYNSTLVMPGGACGFCTFPQLIDGLVWLLDKFHFVLRDWGLAIIALVLLVRGVLHPVTKKSQVNMMQMGKMGPEVERLKKKYGDDKDELNKAMMQLYKEQGIAPVLGCLPMFLQMPIWIALWSALQSEFSLRHAPFLWGYTWIHDLAKPDALIQFSQPIPLYLFGWHLSSINLLPILMGLVFFLQQKYTPKPPTTSPEQEQQQKMMQWMTLLFPVMLYTGPSGLNLYIMTSTAIGLWESKIIRDHIKQKEEAEKAGRVFVEAKATRATKRAADRKAPEEPKRTGILGWLANLQDKTESLRNNDPDKKKKKE